MVESDLYPGFFLWWNFVSAKNPFHEIILPEIAEYL